MEVLKAAFENVNQRIVSIRVGRPQEEARLEHKVPRITDNSFDHLSIIEIHTHPQTLHDWRMLMKMKSPVAEIAIEGLDEKNGFRVFSRNILNSV
nr:hypothetical protein [Granulicella sp. S190]